MGTVAERQCTDQRIATGDDPVGSNHGIGGRTLLGCRAAGSQEPSGGTFPKADNFRYRNQI